MHAGGMIVEVELGSVQIVNDFFYSFIVIDVDKLDVF